MNDFRNKQPGNQNLRPRNTVDGFAVPRGSQQGLGSVRPQRAPQPRLDDFSRPEGATRRSRTRDIKTNAAAPLHDTILVNKPGIPKKRGFFGRLRRKGKKPLTKRKKFALSLTALIIFLMLVGGFLVVKGYVNINKVLKGGGSAAALEQNVDPSKLKGEGDGRVNILMMGRGGEGHDGADLTDTMILVSIDPIAKEASMLSIPRDLWVPVPGYSSMKINAAFATGKQAAFAKATRNNKVSNQQAEEAGFALAEETVEKNLGIPINYHAMVDFSGFRQAIDIVGGIDLNAPAAVAEQMRIDGQNYKLNVKPGQQHMDGFTALAYSRSRHTSARGDFDRAERQRAIIIALKQKLLTAGTVSNPAKISSLLGTLGGHVTSNFSVEDLSRLYQLGKDIDQSKITSIGLADPPNNYVTTGTIAGQSVVVPTAGAGNFKDIKAYLRNILKDSFIRDENASIMVLNGTETAGLATTKADELKTYGYNITAVDNAPTRTYTKTTLVDLRNGSKKYTKNYLEKRFNISAVSTLPDTTILPGTADFVIIVGSDQAGTSSNN